MVYMVTFTINIPPMLAYIPYMDPMGIYILCLTNFAIVVYLLSINYSIPMAGSI